ncbi:hypothetical protein [Vibrio jasicida]|uniref:hypothetical protein n=1 Tax=Vibrio jasicida TaxID=766224 RepID=UPI000CE41F08|nr:hypothetical protein [Vibrio jasicida]
MSKKKKAGINIIGGSFNGNGMGGMHIEGGEVNLKNVQTNDNNGHGLSLGENVNAEIENHHASGNSGQGLFQRKDEDSGDDDEQNKSNKRTTKLSRVKKVCIALVVPAIPVFVFEPLRDYIGNLLS